MGERFVREGDGWRLGWDTAAPHYKGLLAGSTWAIELTEAELRTFRRLVVEISDTMVAIAAEIMDDEHITCEAEADDLWLEAEGFPGAYRLRFLLGSGRRCEGAWDTVATRHIIEAIHQLGVF